MPGDSLGSSVKPTAELSVETEVGLNDAREEDFSGTGGTGLP